MRKLDQSICAWGGLLAVGLLGVGMLVAGFVPPPSPSLTADQVAALYRDNSVLIRVGMIITLIGFIGYAALVGVISVQLRRIPGISRLAPYLQLGAGMVGILTILLPFILFAVAGFRPERDPQLLLLLNDVGWMIAITAFPTFVAQLGATAFGILGDKSAKPVYPRWAAFFNIWMAILFLPAALAYFFQAGPFAWNGLIPFWVAGGAFFVWMTVMSWLTLGAIKRDETPYA